MGSGKKKKREYLNDFGLNSKGEYEYQGTVICWPQKGTARKKILRMMWGCLIISGVSVVIDGCIYGTGLEHRSFMMLPYMIQLVLLVSMFWSGGSLTAAGTKIREYIFQRTVERIPGQALAFSILSGVCIVTDVISICMPDFAWNRKMAVIWMLLELAALVSGWKLKKTFADVKKMWEKCENTQNIK